MPTLLEITIASTVSTVECATLRVDPVHDGEAHGSPHNEHPSLAISKGWGNIPGHDFVTLTWNACGMEKCAEKDVVDLVELEDSWWDVIFIQEGPTRDEGSCIIIDGGHAFFAGKPGPNKRTTCILLHSRWVAAKLSFHAQSERISFLDVDAGSLRLRLTSAHLPHADIPPEVYESVSNSLDEVILGARGSKRMNIIGIDANAVLGRQKVTDDGRIIGEYGGGERNERGHIFAAWLHGLRLSAAATMVSNEWGATWTHELWSTRVRRQIDFVLFDEIRLDTLIDAGIVDALDGKSDHRATFARLRLCEYQRLAKEVRKVQVGWKPALDDKSLPSQYHAVLDAALKGLQPNLAECIAGAAIASAAQRPRPRRKHADEVKALFDQRRNESDTECRKGLSKRLWKALRRQRRLRADDDIDALARKGGGLGKLKQMTNKQAGIQRITAIRDKEGELHRDPDDIAEVFAQFYEDLYKELARGGEVKMPSSAKPSPVTIPEVEQALRALKNGKTGADDGLVAEMLKTGHRGLIEALATFMDGILQDDLEVPESWRAAKLKVIFKKGNPDLPSNYRPISIIPVLAKLYSTILYNRMKEVMDSRLADEQFGFRKGRGCSDAVHILRTVIEKSAEWGEELWVSTLDVEKAFDRVHHSSLFESLLASGMDISIVAALSRLYTDLKASVELWPGEESRFFHVQRGVRQGDPLSPLLFNLVIHHVLEEVRVAWRRRGYGTNVGATVKGERLTHIAFADDISLVARSWISMKRMLSMLREALALRGLRLHPSKCKVQTNVVEWHRRGDTVIEEGFSVEILAEESVLVLLGTVLSLTDTTKHEIDNRLAAGWKLFWGMKRVLLNKKVSINCRLRLFDATVGSCVTWCCESWTPRAEELRKLETARRSMLRKIVSPGRGPTEDWLDWIRRATHKALDWATRASVKEWDCFHCERKWRWAGHVARRSADTWLYRVSTWRDSAWQVLSAELGGSRELRPSTRRWMKWEDQLRRYCSEKGLKPWNKLAADREQWEEHTDAFRCWCASR